MQVGRGAMEKYVFPTPFGEIWAWGEADVLTSEKPVLLSISGAFADPQPMPWHYPQAVPEAAVLLAHLPGNHCPPLIAHSVGIYAAAYSRVLSDIGRPAVVVGGSIGGLTALAIGAPQARAVVALDPPLRTGQLWPLVGYFRRRLREAPDDAALQAFIDGVFGISGQGHEDRDYRPILAGLTKPAWVLFGGDPLLPPRPLTSLPSLVDEPERRLFRSHPLVRTTTLEGVGHNILGSAFQPAVGAIREMLRIYCPPV